MCHWQCKFCPCSNGPSLYPCWSFVSLLPCIFWLGIWLLSLVSYPCVAIYDSDSMILKYPNKLKFQCWKITTRRLKSGAALLRRPCVLIWRFQVHTYSFFLMDRIFCLSSEFLKNIFLAKHDFLRWQHAIPPESAWATSLWSTYIESL